MSHDSFGNHQKQTHEVVHITTSNDLYLEIPRYTVGTPRNHQKHTHQKSKEKNSLGIIRNRLNRQKSSEIDIRKRLTRNHQNQTREIVHYVFSWKVQIMIPMYAEIPRQKSLEIDSITISNDVYLEIPRYTVGTPRNHQKHTHQKS